MSTRKSIFRVFSFLLILELTFSAPRVTPVRAAGILYVTPGGGTGACASWTNACTLQTALINAVNGDEVWVMASTYKPTTGTDRSSTFQLKDGVALYGGFAGTETTRSQRNWTTNVTILSGDIGIVSDNSDNSYHVVTGANNAMMDGFTITEGNSDSINPNDRGGGMYNSSSSPTLANLTFTSNTSYYGGGMYNLSSSPTLTNVTLSGNIGWYGGGGLYNYSSNPTLMNITFSSNSALYGGAMYNSGSSPTMTNITFGGNSATDHGGGMYNYSSNPTLTNTTFSANAANNYGGGMYNSASSNPQIRNTIFWGNAAAIAGAQIYNVSSTPVVSSSVVQDGCPAGSICTAPPPITTDPGLGPPGNYGGATQTIPLLPGSSAIDMGNDATCPATDQRGVARPQGAHCDVGAYEVQIIILAVPDGQTSGLCGSWANACELRYALTSAASGQEIWAGTGTYKPATGADRGATFQLKTGVAVYGGFVGTETTRSQRDPAANVTILSGDSDNNDSQKPIITDLTTVTGNTTNSYHVVTGANTATLDGFTITAGNANTAGYETIDRGGGIYNVSSSPTLTNLIFIGNSASSSGGGMYNYTSSSPTLTNVTFSGNLATYGGGMVNWNSSNPTMTNVTFAGNSATYGGGMSNWNSSNPTLTNVTFSANSATYGGAMYNSGSSPTMTNVTFAGNSAVDHGGGMYIADLSYPQFRNTIFWGNTAAGGIGAQIYNFSGNTTSSDSVVQGGCVDTSWSCGTNIITADPKLGVLGNYGGYTQTIPILASSSAIDTGNNATCADTDQRGITRPQGAHCDIGAYEQDDLTAPTVDTFTATTPSNSLNIPITAFTASDAVGVTGYLINTSLTPPAPGAGGWTGTAPTTYTVASEGSYTLYPWAKDAAGNVSSVFASPRAVVVDNTAPTVVSSLCANPSPTNLANVNFTVTFSEAVIGVDVTDFSLTTTGVSGASVISVSGSGSSYTLAISTGSENGTIRLDIPASATITDLAGNLLTSLPYTAGEMYTITKVYTIFLPLILH